MFPIDDVIMVTLLVDKGEITVLFPRWRVIPAQTGQVQQVLMGFIPMMKLDSHVWI